MTVDEAIRIVRSAAPSRIQLAHAAVMLANEVERLRAIERRALNLVAINERMTSRTARVILGDQ